MTSTSFQDYQNISETSPSLEKSRKEKQSEEKKNVLPVGDELYLAPIQKYRLYNKFPYKLFIHSLLVVFTSLQILFLMKSKTTFTRSQERLFYDAFVSKSDRTDYPYPRIKHLFTVNDVRQHVKNSVERFYLFPETSLEQVYFDSPEGTKPEVIMKVSYMKVNKESKQSKQRQFIYHLSENNYGPFDEDKTNKNVQKFIGNITGFEMNYTLITITPYYYNDYENCIYWNINQQYSFKKRGHVTVSLVITRNPCEGYQFRQTNNTNLDDGFNKNFVAKYIWLHFIVVVLSLTSLILIIKYFHNMFVLYKRVSDKTKGLSEKELKHFGFKSKRKLNPLVKIERVYEKFEKLQSNQDETEEEESKSFIRTSSIFAFVGNILQFFGSILCIFEKGGTLEFTEIALGSGCLLAYINMGKYLQESTGATSIVYNSLYSAIPNTLRIFVGVLPIFLGFTFFALCVFWKSERFSSLHETICNLYAIMNGDIMLDVLNDLKTGSPILGYIFGLVFCTMFLVIVMNIFLSTIGEAYVKNKLKENNNHWIYSFLKLGKDEKISNTEEKSVEAWKNSIKDNISRLVRFIEEEEEMKNELEIVISNKEKRDKKDKEQRKKRDTNKMFSNVIDQTNKNEVKRIQEEYQAYQEGVSAVLLEFKTKTERNINQFLFGKENVMKFQIQQDK
jgi:hypothetical protein